MNRSRTSVAVLTILLCASAGSRADIIVPGADGSDGVLNCVAIAAIPGSTCNQACNTACSATIDLSLAATRPWDTPSPQLGYGVYDSAKWAVVFKYSSVIIPSTVTIRFKNHASRAPVVWLVSGSVQIDGIINLLGSNGGSVWPNRVFAEPGPGGFRGAFGNQSTASYGSAGLGPGGGWYFVNNLDCTANAGHGTTGNNSNVNCNAPPPSSYGNTRLLPLIGGSGGSPGNGAGGAAGGGAILIAARSSVAIAGRIIAYGGQGQGGGLHGSGGGIRIVADAITNGLGGAGNLQANSYNTAPHSVGRIRIEANTVTFTGDSLPVYTSGPPGTTAVLWQSDLGDAPVVRICRVGGSGNGCALTGQPGYVTTDPTASLDFPGADVTVGQGGSQRVVIGAFNVPLDWDVRLRIIPKQGADLLINAAFAGGDEFASTWLATVPLSSGFTVLQARASMPIASVASEEEESQNFNSNDVEP